MTFPRIPVFLALLLVSATAAQVRQIHTRDLTRLSQVQVADVLQRTDIVFVPVGAVEANGILPSDRDYITPLAYAMTMADATGGVYVPGLAWSYPGTTTVAPATVYMSPSDGLAHLKLLARSLLRQGFRRQVYITQSHGPAPLTVGTLAREFFDETHVPILYVDMDRYLPRLKLPLFAHDKILYGAHYITGRIIDIPLEGDYGDAESGPEKPIPPNEGLATLSRLGFSGSLSLGSWIADVMAHGGGPLDLPNSPAQREEWGRQGKAQMESIVAKMSLPEAMEGLRKHDRYTQEVIVPRLGKWMPKR
jgi:creatinine amidohydrolase